ncbi:MAG: hypothetical protein NTV79_04160, partial [Candidatus Aureabacteria bacterium]|nr:hypothetical protein [Candidatus Auribacterota bacterium]
ARCGSGRLGAPVRTCPALDGEQAYIASRLAVRVFFPHVIEALRKEHSVRDRSKKKSQKSEGRRQK